MTPDQSYRAYKLFEQTLERAPDERGAFLAETCGDDIELWAEVESLLEHDSRVPDEFMRPPKLKPTLTGSASTESHDPLIGARVGTFHIQRAIGSGGMGTVYAAEQDQPHRTVALKIINLGMDTHEVVARCESEREALAMMNHSNIAKVFEAGATEQGRPYFVMEHVPGVPITEHCDRHKLDIEQRIKLFIQVCNAVQHAHQKGIIHRDLKPSNILVADEGQQAVPKIIDFGVAKALNQRLSERTIFTEQGQLIGTPEYMSPEQAEMSGQDIDTRADIYSLGVLLYELLTGALPFDSKTLRRAAFGEIQRIIREVEPPTPSTKLASLLTTATAAGIELAARRHSEPRNLLRCLRGDLDWIVMRCLEKDRIRRYETATALAADVRRHLNHEPVLAGPPSAAYRVRKFVRRNRGPVLAAGLVTLALLVGLIGTATFALREAWQRKLAEQNEQKAIDNEALALKRADETKQVADFQASMLSGIDAEQMGRTILRELRRQVRAGLERTWVEGDDGQLRKRTTDEIDALLTQFDIEATPANPTDVARQTMDFSVLAPAVTAITEEFAEQPLVQAQLLDTLGTVYASFGQYDQAKPPLRRALDMRRRLLGDEHVDVAASLNNVAIVLHAKGEFAAAEPLYREALVQRRKLLGHEHTDVATSLNNLAALLYAMGDYAAAEPMYRQALGLRRRLLGNEHPDVAESLNNLAELLHDKGDYNAAEPLYREALRLNRRLLGDEHRHVADALNNLAGLLCAKGEYVAAEPLFREALALSRKLLGNEHPDVAQSLNNLGFLLYAKGDYVAAEPLYREALTLYHRLLGDEHPDVALTLNNLAVLLQAKGDYATAEPLYRETLAMRRKLLGDGHPDVAWTLNNLATLLRAKGDYAAAEPLYLDVLALYRKLLGDEHPDVAWTLNNLAVLKHAKGDYAAAEPLYRQALALREKILPPAHLDTADSRVGLGRVLTKLGRYAEAEPLLLAAQETYFQTPVAPQRSVSRVLKGLVALYDAWHAAEPEKGYDVNAAEWRDKLDQWEATMQTTRSAHKPQP